MSSLVHKLRQPYPGLENKRILLLAVLLGAFVIVFLSLFQPFGLQLLPDTPGKYTAIAGYGFITFAVVVINGIVMPALFPRVYNRETWTLGADLFLQGFLNFFFVGAANMLYSVLMFHFRLSIGQFVFFQLATVSVGLLPYAILVLVRYNMLLKQNMADADKLNSEINNTHPVAARLAEERTEVGTGADAISFYPSQMLYAAAADNYVKIVLEGNGPRMVRLTLKTLEELLLPYENIVRCHRAYIVNLDKVVSFSGNAQGLKLEVGDTGIPVSRAMAAQIKGLLSATTAATDPNTVQPATKSSRSSL